MWQRQTDIYVAVVRLPDRPHLRLSGDQVELIPGENHWETRGYEVLRDGKSIALDPIGPGESFALPGGGTYTAIAIERSGLRSQPSQALQLEDAADLRILKSKPTDFSWTRDRFLVHGREASQQEANRSAEAIREIVHLHDGVIHREWHRKGTLTKRHDLNPNGKPIRHLYYKDGKLSRREFHTRDGKHISTEQFDADGYITASTHGSTHWWYERGAPIKFTNGSVTFFTDRERWRKQ